MVYCKLILGRCYIIQRVLVTQRNVTIITRKKIKSERVYEGKGRRINGKGKMKRKSTEEGQTKMDRKRGRIKE